MNFVEKSAVIGGSNDEFRYLLIRIWRHDMPRLVVCMLNPSTADASIDDPTILALIHFGIRWGFGGLHIVNENAFRASQPQIMMQAADPRGPANFRYLDQACEYAAETSGMALAAWGNGTTAATFRKYAERHRIRLVCLGMTKSGAPKHPMARGLHRIPRDQQPITWRSA